MQAKASDILVQARDVGVDMSFLDSIKAWRDRELIVLSCLHLDGASIKFRLRSHMAVKQDASTRPHFHICRLVDKQRYKNEAGFVFLDTTSTRTLVLPQLLSSYIPLPSCKNAIC